MMKGLNSGSDPPGTEQMVDGLNSQSLGVDSGGTGVDVHLDTNNINVAGGSDGVGTSTLSLGESESSFFEQLLSLNGVMGLDKPDLLFASAADMDCLGDNSQIVIIMEQDKWAESLLSKQVGGGGMEIPEFVQVICGDNSSGSTSTSSSSCGGEGVVSDQIINPNVINAKAANTEDISRSNVSADVQPLLPFPGASSSADTLGGIAEVKIANKEKTSVGAVNLHIPRLPSSINLKRKTRSPKDPSIFKMLKNPLKKSKREDYLPKKKSGASATVVKLLESSESQGERKQFKSMAKSDGDPVKDNVGIMSNGAGIVNTNGLNSMPLLQPEILQNGFNRSELSNESERVLKLPVASATIVRLQEPSDSQDERKQCKSIAKKGGDNSKDHVVLMNNGAAIINENGLDSMPLLEPEILQNGLNGSEASNESEHVLKPPVASATIVRLQDESSESQGERKQCKSTAKRDGDASKDHVIMSNGAGIINVNGLKSLQPLHSGSSESGLNRSETSIESERVLKPPQFSHRKKESYKDCLPTETQTNDICKSCPPNSEKNVISENSASSSASLTPTQKTNEALAVSPTVPGEKRKEYRYKTPPKYTHYKIVYDRTKMHMNTYKCFVCGQEGFEKYADLKNHRKYVHMNVPYGNADTEEMPFACGVCGKPFHLREDALVCALLAHDPTTLSKQMFRYACSKCPKERLRFHSVVALKKHWEIEHGHKFEAGNEFGEDVLPSVVVSREQALKLKTTKVPITSDFPLIAEHRPIHNKCIKITINEAPSDRRNLSNNQGNSKSDIRIEEADQVNAVTSEARSLNVSKKRKKQETVEVQTDKINSPAVATPQLNPTKTSSPETTATTDDKELSANSRSLYTIKKRRKQETVEVPMEKINSPAVATPELNPAKITSLKTATAATNEDKKWSASSRSLSVSKKGEKQEIVKIPMDKNNSPAAPTPELNSAKNSSPKTASTNDDKRWPPYSRSLNVSKRGGKQKTADLQTDRIKSSAVATPELNPAIISSLKTAATSNDKKWPAYSHSPSLHISKRGRKPKTIDIQMDRTKNSAVATPKLNSTQISSTKTVESNDGKRWSAYSRLFHGSTKRRKRKQESVDVPIDKMKSSAVAAPVKRSSPKMVATNEGRTWPAYSQSLYAIKRGRKPKTDDVQMDKINNSAIATPNLSPTKSSSPKTANCNEDKKYPVHSRSLHISKRGRKPKTVDIQMDTVNNSAVATPELNPAEIPSPNMTNSSENKKWPTHSGSLHVSKRGRKPKTADIQMGKINSSAVEPPELNPTEISSPNMTNSSENKKWPTHSGSLYTSKMERRQETVDSKMDKIKSSVATPELNFAKSSSPKATVSNNDKRSAYSKITSNPGFVKLVNCMENGFTLVKKSTNAQESKESNPQEENLPKSPMSAKKEKHAPEDKELEVEIETGKVTACTKNTISLSVPSTMPLLAEGIECSAEFTCEICKRSFGRKCSLKFHESRAHPKPEPQKTTEVAPPPPVEDVLIWSQPYYYYNHPITREEAAEVVLAYKKIESKLETSKDISELEVTPKLNPDLKDSSSSRGTARKLKGKGPVPSPSSKMGTSKDNLEVTPELNSDLKDSFSPRGTARKRKGKGPVPSTVSKMHTSKDNCEVTPKLNSDLKDNSSPRGTARNRKGKGPVVSPDSKMETSKDNLEVEVTPKIKSDLKDSSSTRGTARKRKGKGLVASPSSEMETSRNNLEVTPKLKSDLKDNFSPRGTARKRKGKDPVESQAGVVSGITNSSPTLITPNTNTPAPLPTGCLNIPPTVAPVFSNDNNQSNTIEQHKENEVRGDVTDKPEDINKEEAVPSTRCPVKPKVDKTPETTLVTPTSSKTTSRNKEYTDTGGNNSGNISDPPIPLILPSISTTKSPRSVKCPVFLFRRGKSLEPPNVPPPPTRAFTNLNPSSIKCPMFMFRQGGLSYVNLK